MKTIITKYNGICRHCGKELNIGDKVNYEKHIGIFCLEHTLDLETLRSYKQENADKKADRYLKSAERKINEAEAVIKHNRIFTDDYAFLTQPYLPARDKIYAQNDRAFQKINEAVEMKERAEDLRYVYMKGDAEREREQERNSILSWLKVGQRVEGWHFDYGTVQKINKKTVNIKSEITGNIFNTKIEYIKGLA